MDAIVDYDNLLEEEKQQGLLYIAEAILAAIGPVPFRDEPRLHLRFYDGFYQERALTRRAQAIATEIFGSFPCTIKLRDAERELAIRTSAEPAYSLISDPSKHLWYTFRPKGPSPNLRCKSPKTIGCKDANCPMDTVLSVFRRSGCTRAGCSLPSGSLIHQPQQKLVDTMMTADLVHLAHRGDKSIVVVSSDDDLWPAIQAVASTGAAVYHVHTRDRGTPSHYAAHVGSEYHEAKLTVRGAP